MLILGLLILGLLIFGLLIFGLLILLIVLVLLVVLLLVVLFLLLGRRGRLGLGQFALGEVEILLGVGVGGVGFERFLQVLDGVFEVGLALGFLLYFVAPQGPLQQRGAEVVLRFAAQLRVVAREGFAKGHRGCFEVALCVLRRAFVEFQRWQAGAALGQFFELRLGFSEFPLLIQLDPFVRSHRARRECQRGQAGGHGSRAHAQPWRFATALVDQDGADEEHDAEAERPLVALDGPLGQARVDLRLLQFPEP